MGNNNMRPLTGPDFIKVFTDGSSLGNPGPSGWAWVVNKISFMSGSEPHATNQRMELMAIRDALMSLPKATNVEVLTDSEFCVNVFTKWGVGWAKRGWRKADGNTIANKDVIVSAMKLLAARKGKTVFTHVKAHCGVVNNEVADRLANKAASSQSARRGPGWADVKHIPSADGHRVGAVKPAVKDTVKDFVIVGKICESCGGQINPLTLRCRCFSD